MWGHGRAEGKRNFSTARLAQSSERCWSEETNWQEGGAIADAGRLFSSFRKRRADEHRREVAQWGRGPSFSLTSRRFDPAADLDHLLWRLTSTMVMLEHLRPGDRAAAAYGQRDPLNEYKGPRLSNPVRGDESEILREGRSHTRVAAHGGGGDKARGAAGRGGNLPF